MGNVNTASSNTKHGKANNGASSPRNNEKHRSKGRAKHNDRDRPLGEHDLDDIYNFIKNVKESNDGADLLGEFLERQSPEVEGLEDILDDVKKMEPFPIQTIIVNQEKAPAPRRHRPTVSPSA